MQTSEVRDMQSAVDTHAHVFPPAFPIPHGPGNKPAAYEMKTREDYLAVLREHGMTHGMLVQPSTYQSDNSAMLDAIAHAGGSVKGTAILDYAVSDAAMDQLARDGILGARFNLIDLDAEELEKPEAARMLERLRERNWWTEIHAFAPALVSLASILERNAGRVMFDHVGRPQIEHGLEEPGFKRLLELGRTRRHCVKLSGAIRISKQAFPFADVDPYVHAVIEAFGIDNCVWGSDWPFITLEARITYTQSVEWLKRIFPREDDRRRILWDNPVRLFGYTT